MDMRFRSENVPSFIGSAGRSLRFLSLSRTVFRDFCGRLGFAVRKNALRDHVSTQKTSPTASKFVSRSDIILKGERSLSTMQEDESYGEYSHQRYSKT